MGHHKLYCNFRDSKTPRRPGRAGEGACWAGEARIGSHNGKDVATRSGAPGCSHQGAASPPTWG